MVYPGSLPGAVYKSGLVVSSYRFIYNTMPVVCVFILFSVRYAAFTVLKKLGIQVIT
jgi:hypothetical protein